MCGFQFVDGGDATREIALQWKWWKAKRIRTDFERRNVRYRCLGGSAMARKSWQVQKAVLERVFNVIVGSQSGNTLN